MIATASIIEIIVCHAGNSFKINQVIIPNITVPKPKPIILIFHTPPKIKYDNDAAFHSSQPIGIPSNTTIISLLSHWPNFPPRNCPCI